MSAPTARNVTIKEIQVAQALLKHSLARIEEVLTIMADNSFEEVELRAHNILSAGSRAMKKMANELRDRAEDRLLAKEFGQPTPLEKGREFRKKYSKTSEVKKTAKK